LQFPDHPQLTAAQGLTVIVESKSGEAFEGLMAGTVPAAGSTKFSLKMTKKLPAGTSQSNGIASREAALTGMSPDHAVTFDLRDVAQLQIPAFSMPDSSRMANGKSA
jgi:hypothetical protein